MSLYTVTLGTSGSRVVLLHGLFGQGRNWNTIGRALAGEHRVRLVDLPDHGRSPWTERVDYLAMADQVAGLFDPRDPVALVGHSMGGKVAMVLALRHPELVARLVVADISPVAYDTVPGQGLDRYVQAMRSLDLATLTSREEADRLLAGQVSSPSVRAFLLQNLRRDLSHEGTAGGWRWQMNLDVLGRDLPVIADWPADRLGQARYDGPVLWMAGEHSDYVQDAYVAAMTRWFPRARRVRIKAAGHWVHADQPEVVLAVLRDFLTWPG